MWRTVGGSVGRECEENAKSAMQVQNTTKLIGRRGRTKVEKLCGANKIHWAKCPAGVDIVTAGNCSGIERETGC